MDPAQAAGLRRFHRIAGYRTPLVSFRAGAASLLPLLLASLLCSGPIAAQAGAAAPAEFVHEVWTVQEGLPVNSVNGVLQSPRGYLWLATWDGLVRFDGARFTVFSTGNTEALPSNRIVELVQAGDGSLWLRTEQNHLVRVRAGEFTHIGPEHGVRDGSMRVLHVDAQGELWIATEEGVHRFAGERFLRVAGQATEGMIEVLLHDAAGTLWVGTRGHGLYRLAGETVTRIDTSVGLDSDWVTRLLEDRSGALWIGTSGGVQRYRDGRLERLYRGDGVPLAGHVRELQAAPAADEVWIATEAGLYAYREEELRIVRETPDRLLLPNVRFEASGTVWYSVGDDLFRDGQAVFRVPRGEADDGQGAEIHTFTWDHEGSLWIGTHSLGLHRLKPAVFRVYSRAEGLPHRNVATVLEDGEGELWVGTMGRGLARIREGRITRYTPAAGYPSFATALLQDEEGNLWVGTHRNGIFHCRLPGMLCAPPPSQPGADASVAALHRIPRVGSGPAPTSASSARATSAGSDSPLSRGYSPPSSASSTRRATERCGWVRAATVCSATGKAAFGRSTAPMDCPAT